MKITLAEMFPSDLGADAEGFEIVNQGQTPTMVPDGSEVNGGASQRVGDMCYKCGHELQEHSVEVGTCFSCGRTLDSRRHGVNKD